MPTKPIPIRLDDEVVARLDAAADRIGSNRAAVVRMLITGWLDDFDSKGRSMLPVDFEDIVKAFDHRTKEAKSKKKYPGAKESGLKVAVEREEK